MSVLEAAAGMKAVTVYTRPLCSFCVRAIMLLKRKGAVVTEICVAFDPEKSAEMIKRTNGRRTYPQIFIGDTHVGGSDDLLALETAGKLEQLLHD